MATAAPSSRSSRKSLAERLPSLGLSSEKGREIAGLLIGAFALLLTLALASFHPGDPSLLHVAGEGAKTHNLVGPVGANLADLLVSLLGFTAVLTPVPLLLTAWRRLRKRPPLDHRNARILGGVLLLAAVPALLQLAFGAVSYRGAPLPAGGGLGVLVAEVFTDRLNVGGTVLVLLTLAAVGGALAIQSTLGELVVELRRRFDALGDRWALWRARRAERKEKARTRRRVVSAHVERQKKGDADLPRETGVVRRRDPAPPEPPPATQPARVVPKKGEGHFSVRKVTVEPEPVAEEPELPETRQEDLGFEPDEISPSELPPVNLLELSDKGPPLDEKELVHRGEVIQTSCEEFGVSGTIEGIGPGPVITVYELQPAPGVKVSRIVNLQDDLALALKAESVRIDRIPGRSTLGIEVPNEERGIIRLGRLLADDTFDKSPSVLTMALGVDIHGRPVYADLATMPHLLVAGATGAGKSVGLQSMITSILYKATRDEVQFIFIDPKRIELGVYADIPHLKTEVVVEPKKAANALRWAVAEMERRYKLLAEVHVRSIAYYNRAISDPKERKRLALKEGDGEISLDDLKPLPYYVVVIDELADLMMVAASDVETAIARLAQMARAVGIHLIIATQRPSVDVLTGTIKANFPCRLAYATATRHDSRTILDTVGAEKLLGKGDALFMPPGASRIRRLHGAYVSEQETAALIRWLKRRGKPEYDPEVVRAMEDDSGSTASGGGEGDDELFDEAARLVVSERQGSASFLQRRLRVGFSRAARIIDMLEGEGILGPPQGSKPRDVLVPPDWFEEIDQHHEQG